MGDKFDRGGLGVEGACIILFLRSSIIILIAIVFIWFLEITTLFEKTTNDLPDRSEALSAIHTLIEVIRVNKGLKHSYNKF